MRRVLSILLFLLGGWMLMTETMVAFLDVERGAGDNVVMIVMFALVATLFLVLGAWASPGQRWRELGLTMLIAAGITAFCGLSMAVMLLDPAMLRYMPAVKNIVLAPVTGVLNLIAVTAIGWLSYRRRDSSRPVEAD